MKTFNGVYDNKEKRPLKPKKPVYTPEELENDPSLKWFPYHRWEALWHEEKQANFRFVRYEDGMIRIATMNGISELPELVKKTDVRRITSR